MNHFSFVNVMVKDQDRAIEFYRNKLGFVVAEDLPYGKERWITLQAPGDKTPSISLNLAVTDADLKLVGKQAGSQIFLGLATKDCMADFRRMKAAGVNFQGEPEVKPYGTGVILEDLYGNRIHLNQEIAS
jgi:predicted enzyme related to lactoylglutathione lyase